MTNSLTDLPGWRTSHSKLSRYGSSEAAPIQYLAHDLGPDGIRVNDQCRSDQDTRGIGYSRLRTLLTKTAEINPLRRTINGEDIAGSALYLLSSLSSGVTGEIIHVDAGYHILGAHE